MDQSLLFDLPECPPTEPTPVAPGKPRLRVAEREQVVVRMLSLEQMLPAADDARMAWEFVCQTDLSELYARIAAVEGVAGRDATDPQILLALWLYATIKRIGSARTTGTDGRTNRGADWAQTPKTCWRTADTPVTTMSRN